MNYVYIIYNILLYKIKDIKSEYRLLDSKEICYIQGRKYLINSERFNKKITKIPWFVYSRSFEEYEGQTSDIGWGCMYRTIQMLLANTLIIIKDSSDQNISEQSIDYSDILLLFEDNKDALFSIHNLASYSYKYTNNINQWITPSNSLKIASEILSKNKNQNQNPNINLEILLTENSSISPDDIKRVLENIKRNTKIILSVPVRLGINNINCIYIPQIIEIFKIRQNIGIIGGIGTKSCYFYGLMEKSKHLLYLDPHDIFKSNNVDSVDISDLNPTMAFTFLIESEKDIENVINNLQTINKKFNIINV